MVQLVVVLFLVTFFTSALINMVPGDPTVVIIPFGTQAQRDALAHDLHLDEPLYKQYASWVNGILHGDLGCYYGTSGYSSGGKCADPVSPRLKHALPISLALMFYAQLLS